MLLPLVVAFLAVSIGAWLALGPREGTASVRPIRLIAIVAAVIVILVHLLPEAFHELGFRALLGFAAGVAVPTVTERVGAALSKRPGESAGGALAGLEIAYAGLVVHRFGDGLSMGAYSPAHGLWAQAGVVLAIALHIVPVTTVMVLAIIALRGRRSAFFRSAILALSTMGGVIVAGTMVAGGRPGAEADVSPWISAFVAGLLLHIVAHDLPGRHSHAG